MGVVVGKGLARDVTDITNQSVTDMSIKLGHSNK